MKTNNVVIHNFVVTESKKYFDLVCDKTNWKNPIESVCSSDEIKKVYEAILFYTATEARFEYMGILEKTTITNDRFKKGDHIMKVTAKGYYGGPAN